MGLTIKGLVIGGAAMTACAAAAPAAKIDRWEMGGTGGWDYLTLDATAHRLFVTRFDRVEVLDSRSGAMLGTVAGTEGVHGVALDQRGRGFTSNGRANSVTRFNTSSLAVERVFAIPGENPDAIVYESTTDEVWTFNGKSHDATAIDAETGRVAATISLGGKPEFAVSDGHGTIFVNDEDHALIHAIDVRKHRLQATWSLPGCEEPSGLALDSRHSRLFSVCANETMAVTDSVSGRHVATVPIGAGPDAVAYDATLNEIYSSNGRDGTLTLIHERDPDHFDIEATLLTQPSARTLALDPLAHRVYVAAARFDTPLSEPAATKPRRPTMAADSFCILVVDVTPSKRGRHYP